MAFFQNQYNNFQEWRNNTNNPQQAQAQKYMNQQQQTAQTQRFKEQVDDTFEMVVLAAEMSQDSNVGEAHINRMTDGAILTLNLLAKACSELHKQSDQDSIDIAKKQVIDKWSALKCKNGNLYKLTIPHRDFIIAALNGVPNLKYESSRVKASGGQERLFQNDPKVINQAFGQVIKRKQEFDKRQESFLEPNTNKELASQHQHNLNQYRTNDQYKQHQQHQQHQQYQRPKQSDLYFTKSGKNATFINAKAESAQKAMNDELFGVNKSNDDAYNKLPHLKYDNVALKLSTKKSWNGIKELYPCRIIRPNQNDDEIHQKITVQPAYPHNRADLMVPVELIETNINKIKKCEKKHLRNDKYGKLGYTSIQQKQHQEQNDIDIDML